MNFFLKSNSGPQGRSRITHRYLVPCPKMGLDIVTLNNAIPKSKMKCYHHKAELGAYHPYEVNEGN